MFPSTVTNGRRTRVYLACPITAGDRCWNFYQSCRAQEILMRAGYAVMAPALSMMHPNAWNMPHKLWLDCDLPWVEAADVLVRLPGASLGADMEVQHATAHGIFVWETHVRELERLFANHTNGDPKRG